jgi:hypothetical protein
MKEQEKRLMRNFEDFLDDQITYSSDNSLTDTQLIRNRGVNLAIELVDQFIREND